MEKFKTIDLNMLIMYRYWDNIFFIAKYEYIYIYLSNSETYSAIFTKEIFWCNLLVPVFRFVAISLQNHG